MIRRIVACLLALALMLCSLPALAATDAVTRCNVRLRKAASTESDTLDILIGGTPVSVIAPGGAWSKVQYAGKTGYVASQYLMELTRSGFYPLKEGDENPFVKDLQNQLALLGYYGGSADGKFGATTLAAVLAFQQTNGLGADGIAGGGTQALLFSGNAKVATGAVVTTPATTTPTTTTVSATTLRIGSRGNEVKNLQARLIELGFLSGKADGIFGVATQSAVVSFQKRASLKADGLAGSATQSALYAATAPSSSATTQTPTDNGSTLITATLKRGMKSDAVKTMQQKLIAMGYMTASATGYFGSSTYAAVRAFQQKNKLVVDGIAGVSTLNTLYGDSAIPSGNSTVAGGTSTVTAGKITGPAKSNVKLLHWFNVVKPLLKSGSSGAVLQIYDPATGYGWKLRAYSLGNHMDSEPLTAEDTLYMNAAFGGVATWTPKVVYVKLTDGRWTLATQHNVPHLSGSISNNNFNGHLCLHFLRDMAECSKNDPDYGVQHQNAIRAGWKALTGLTVID